MTCDRCDKRETCRTLCHDMNIVVSASTRSHESPITCFQFPEIRPTGDGFEETVDIKRLIVPSFESKIISKADEEETRAFIQGEMEAFATKYGHGDSTRKEQLLLLLEYSFFDNHTDMRVCELLGEKWPEFAMMSSYENRSRLGGDKVYIKTKPARTSFVNKMVKLFDGFLRARHINRSINTILTTGDITSVKKVAA
jgi:hypothetical protein